MNCKQAQRGVTLIELVVVMIIVGILAAVAIPSYRSYVVRSQRSDAKDALLALVTAQEKFYLQCNTYAGAIDAATSCADGELAGADTSKNGWYDLDVADESTTTFTATATAVAGENQFQDTDCREFSVDQAGVRLAENAGGTDNTDECWR